MYIQTFRRTKHTFIHVGRHNSRGTQNHIHTYLHLVKNLDLQVRGCNQSHHHRPFYQFSIKRDVNYCLYMYQRNIAHCLKSKTNKNTEIVESKIGKFLDITDT